MSVCISPDINHGAHLVLYRPVTIGTLRYHSRAHEPIIQAPCHDCMHFTAHVCIFPQIYNLHHSLYCIYGIVCTVYTVQYIFFTLVCWDTYKKCDRKKNERIKETERQTNQQKQWQIETRKDKNTEECKGTVWCGRESTYLPSLRQDFAIRQG